MLRGGLKLILQTILRNFGGKIGYSPNSADLNASLNAEEDEIEQVGGVFTPAKAPVRDGQTYVGVLVSRFPKGIDHGQIMEFLCRCSLPEEKKGAVLIKENGKVTIKNLSNDESDLLIDAINGKIHFDRKLYCNGIIPLTPEKVEDVINQPGELSQEGAGLDAGVADGQDAGDKVGKVGKQPGEPVGDVVGQQAMDAGVGGPQNHGVNTELQVDKTLQAEASGGVHLDKSLSSDAQEPFWRTGHQALKDPLFWNSDEQTVRRHSISLTNRTPPRASIAADILDKTPFLSKTRLAVGEIRDLTDRLSDFISCNSDSDSSSSEYTESEGNVGNSGWKTMNEKTREKKKRKNSSSPNKDLFLKKQALDAAQQ